nr:C40 family peptidase [Tomitella biformata]
MGEALATPIIQLINAVGTGVAAEGDPAIVLTAAVQGVTAAMEIGQLAAGEVGSTWSGPDATASFDSVASTVRAGQQIAEQGEEINQVLTVATADMNRGVGELGVILESFISAALVQGPAIMTPVGQLALVATAAEHLERALVVVTRMRGELGQHTGAMAAAIPAPPMPPTPDAALMQQGRALWSMAGDAIFGPADGGPADSRPADGSGGAVAAETSEFEGGGVQVTLPDGSTAMAPNETAANAVRAALTQQGVPYSWGGTSPGQGLDCSGLTQWAYGEAGMDLPRTAQEQSVGAAVSQNDLLPGDLAVWDGHVAMVIGDGQMVEAGDPVQVSSVRTTNLDMGFKGFYRPTGG